MLAKYGDRVLPDFDSSVPSMGPRSFHGFLALYPRAHHLTATLIGLFASQLVDFSRTPPLLYLSFPAPECASGNAVAKENIPPVFGTRAVPFNMKTVKSAVRYDALLADQPCVYHSLLKIVHRVHALVSLAFRCPEQPEY